MWQLHNTLEGLTILYTTVYYNTVRLTKFLSQPCLVLIVMICAFFFLSWLTVLSWSWMGQNKSQHCNQAVRCSNQKQNASLCMCVKAGDLNINRGNHSSITASCAQAFFCHLYNDSPNVACWDLAYKQMSVMLFFAIRWHFISDQLMPFFLKAGLNRVICHYREKC